MCLWRLFVVAVLERSVRRDLGLVLYGMLLRRRWEDSRGLCRWMFCALVLLLLVRR